MSCHEKNGPTVRDGGADHKENIMEQDQNVVSAALSEPLFALAGTGYDLIPLNAPGALDRHGRKIGKAPLGKGWRSAPAMDGSEAIDYMQGGCNVGVRLRPTDLVIDYDPRHDPGADALNRLVADFKLAQLPCVLTGGGGTHIYLRVPAGEYSESLDDYPGVEFKGIGRQVVAPGSIHPDTGRAYIFQPDPLDDEMAQDAPAELLSALE